MDKKAIVVEIEDLREFIGGAADVTVSEEGKSGPEPSYPGAVNGTSMCWYCVPSDAADDWTVIKGK